ncbi:MAG: metallopeptidase TldD-related protein [Rhodospirillales bacterium]|nr:metallopeptidase TldD-related protein [Rhodospirillales bacterium]
MMDTKELLGDLVQLALKKGAQAADAVLVDQTSLSAAWRLGKLEHLDRSEASDIGLRVLIGQRQALVSSADRSPKSLNELALRAVAMARNVPEDPFCGLADPADLAKNLPSLDLADDFEPSSEMLVERARRCEDAALAVSGVNNSEGGDAGWGRTHFVIAGSNGMLRESTVTSFSQSAAVLAGSGLGMSRDYDWASSVHFKDLPEPERTGRTAGERTVKHLGARKMPTAKVPVVYESRVARSLLGHFAGAINGASIARGTSFLKDKMGQPVFAKGLRVIDDPHRLRGLKSRPCDAEGLPNQRLNLIKDGVLTSWVLDLRSARQLGLKSTGHAARGTSSPPSPSTSNLYLEPGPLSLADLIKDIDSGFFVTDLYGMGVNGITGDYSRGAAGYWIEKGQIAFPVNEMTVAGNLNDMFLNLTPASDLEFKSGTDSPAVRIEGMTVAGG